MIFNIQRFSTHDGKGIRTNIFFKGCTIKCKWCSNPESQNLQPDIFFVPKKCIHCLECVKCSKNNEFSFENGKIVFNRDAVKDPLTFKDICPSKAMEVIGSEVLVEEILAEVLKDLPFYNESDGGVTISGGEPFFQPELLEKLTKELKKLNINVAVETCLDVPWSNIERSVPYIDDFLSDLKHIDAAKYKKSTGGNMDRVLSNFKNLETAGANVIARIPVIPGFNDTEAELHSIIDFASTLNNLREVNFLPYHSFGTNKYTQLGIHYNFNKSSVDDGLIKRLVVYSQNKGLAANIGG